MIRFNFYLKSGVKNEFNEQPIVIRFNHNYQRTEIRIREDLQPKYWSKRNQMPVNNYANINKRKYDAIVNKIDFYTRKSNQLILELAEEGKEPNRNTIKNFFKTIPITDEGVEFLEVFDMFIETKKAEASKNTIKGYRTVYNFLVRFESETGYKITFPNCNLLFFDKLKNYAFLNRRVAQNYFAKIRNVLVTFLNWATERDFNSNTAYHKFKAPEREKEVLYLEQDELLKLYNYEFESKRLDKARDLFCFGCFTGLRFSDIQAITSNQVQGDFIVMNIQKTRRPEYITLNKFAKAILEKNNASESYKALPKISNQKLNEYIKDACKEAGIDQPVTVYKYSGGETTTETTPKYELITSHVARKTYVTLSLQLGLDVKTIKKNTGHKKDSEFEKYLNIPNDYRAKQNDETWNKLDENKND